MRRSLGHAFGLGLIGPELVYQASKGIGLSGQTMTGSRRFLDHGGVLLGHLIHLVDRDIDLLKASGLLMSGGSDLAHQGVDLADVGHDAVESDTSGPHEIDAGTYLLGRGIDQALDLLGRLGGPLGERADL